MCERILNREGSREREIRPLRIENRGRSRCAWAGCNKVTPQRHKAIRHALAQFVYTVYKARITDDEALQKEIEDMLDRLVTLAKRYRNASGQDRVNERKILLKRVREELKPLKNMTEGEAVEANVEDVKKAWRQIKTNLENIIKRQTGRNRYCRYHSVMYVGFLLDGKAIPFKRSLTERDMTSRRDEILFGKLWRYIEARVLPLSPEGIDRVVVERSAFDLLAGTRSQRIKISDKALEEMYQQGPRYGFKNDLEMLKEEFGGLCAYCGQPKKNLLEREHILPRAIFFFDSYINIVAACSTCNTNLKGKMSPGPAGLRIHDEAYQAYSSYIRTKYRTKPPHLFQTIKKGILNLMRQPDRVWEAEKYLGLLAKHFSDISQTQRGPRPLARFLCEKLRIRQGNVPDVAFHSGRHTEVWRRAAYPDFDKASEKSEGGLLNHALDALLMACDLPSVAALEAKHLRSRDLNEWKNMVKMRAPKAGEDGIPLLPKPVAVVPGFETLLSGNFVSTDLVLFNWNRKNTGIHQQDPFGWSDFHGNPVKRVKAAELASDLKKLKQKEAVEKVLDRIIHPNLKSYLRDALDDDKPGEKAAEALREWLSKSLLNSLSKSKFSHHPGDKARQMDLQGFAQDDTSNIPAVIGVTMEFPEVRGKVYLQRRDPQTGGVLHRYMTNPSNAALLLAYARDKKGKTNRKTPLILKVRQNGALEVKSGKRYFLPIPEGVLQGRMFGDKNNRGGVAGRNKEWESTLREYLTSCDLAEYTLVHQGCVLKYEEGTEWFVRNFSPNYGFKSSILKGVVGIRKTPLSRSTTPLIRLHSDAER